MGEPVSHILQGDQLESLSDCLVQGFRGPGLDGSQIPFQLRPQVFNRIEIRGIWGQVKEPCPYRLQGLSDTVNFMSG
jgi:hypothetical protein